MRQARNYGALNETHRESLPRTRSGVDEERNSEPEAPSQAASRQPRSYGAVHQTHWQLDERQSPAADTPERPATVRSWTHYGGMVPQQTSANDWIKQNYEISMSDNAKPGAGREGAQSPQPGRDQNGPELQEARAAVEEARRREAAERARLQERDRSGPER